MIAATSRLPERLAYGMFATVARLFIRFATKRRELGITNLRRAFPDADEQWLDRTVRRATVNAFQNVLDMVLMLRHLERGTFHDRVDSKALADLEVDGAWLGLAAHLGSWEVSAIGCAQLGRETHAIGRLPKNPLLAQFLYEKRGKSGLILHPRRGGIRPLARALHDGKVGLQVIDQNQRLRGIFVPFCGTLAATERSAATLVLKRGYPMRFGSAIRVGRDFRFQFDVVEVLPPEPTGDTEADLTALCTRINETVEDFARRYPEQYLWIHDRYRTRPPAEAQACNASLAS